MANLYSNQELESLSFRELQKIAKKRKLRQSGKGITKKVLVSLLLDAVPESPDERNDTLPLKELEVQSFHPVSSSDEISFEERTFSDAERELNDSNKENNRRRLTYEITEPKSESPLVRGVQSKKSPRLAKLDEKQSTKRVRIHESPKAHLSTPKPPIKIVKTPIPNRKSSGRPGALAPSRSPTSTQKTMNTTSMTAALSVKKQLLPSKLKTPTTVQKTPRLNKTVLLRVASSVKKSAAEANRSRIPKLDVKKAPNFSNIHQNAFEKMDSLWDVEHQRNLRRRNVQRSGPLFSFRSKTDPPRKNNAKGETKKPETGAVFRFGANNVTVPAAENKPTINKVHAKDTARKAVTKLIPERGNAMKEEQRTFLKGVRLNRRFQMQMQNRGLL